MSIPSPKQVTSGAFSVVLNRPRWHRIPCPAEFEKNFNLQENWKRNIRSRSRCGTDSWRFAQRSGKRYRWRSARRSCAGSGAFSCSSRI